MRSTNKSGISGVQFRQHSPTHPGAWIAITYMQGGKLHKTFSVKEHGNEKAKALAIAERQKQLKQLARLSKAQRKRVE